ncbi:MAG: GNAT family N-acetyltransferase [Acidobacteriota bacterium]
MDVAKPPYLVTTDPSRIDFDVVHGFLSHSYWAENIPRETMAKAIEHSTCFSLFKGDEQIGFARVITDRATFAYLADVFVLEAHRGAGVGVWFMSVLFAHPDLQGLRRFQLATRDAHGLYRKFGFETPKDPSRLMEIVKTASDLYPK